MYLKNISLSLMLLLSTCIIGLRAQTVSDVDGNLYPTVVIGSQTWMAKNLSVSKFRNGEEIPEARTSKKWNAANNAGKPAWCYYNYDAANGNRYGKLYNWHAAADPRGIAPEGWHVPSDAEWTMLIDTLGGEKIAGAHMKSKTGWDGTTSKTENVVITDGFTGLPGGSCNHSGSFYGIGDIGAWWSTTWSRIDIAWAHSLYFGSDFVSRDGDYKRVGLSVRCVKD